MARINIEDCWWTDPRRSKLIKLVGDESLADGIAVKMWRLAQEFWGRGRELIPSEVFETIEANAKLIEAKLAEAREGGIYVRGSSQYLDWAFERREAARKGGKKSGEKRRSKADASTKNQKVTGSKRKQTQASDSGSVSDSVSDSGSDSDSVIPSSPDKSAESIRAETWVAYRDAYRERWGSEPERNAAVNSQIKMLVERVGENAIPLVRFYLAHNSSFYIGKGHPIGLCVSDYQGLMTQMKRGHQFTNAELRQIDTTQTNLNTLELIRKVGV